MKVCPTCQAEFDDETDYCPADGAKLRRRNAQVLDPMLGKVLEDRWVVEKKLGEGGMGAVYLAHQRSMSRYVAVKTLRKELVSSDQFVDRFMREVQVATALSHPHIVTVLDFGQDTDGTLFLVMELLEGEELTARLARGPMADEEALLVAIQIASALEAAHAMSIVHRDLKPDNVFMLKMPGGGTFAKVLDFGIAKVLDVESKVTKTGMIFGTPEYMSPEQCKGVGVDHRSDFYALGCMLFEMLGGRTPFRAETPMALLLAHVSAEAPRPSSFGVAIDADVEEFVMQLLSKDADDRPSTATAVREKLQHLLANLEPGGSDRSAVMPVAAAGPAKSSMIWAAAGAVLFSAAGLSAYLLWPDGATAPAAEPVVEAQVEPFAVVPKVVDPLFAAPEVAEADVEPVAVPEPPSPALEVIAERKTSKSKVATKPEPVVEVAKPEPAKAEPVAKPKPVRKTIPADPPSEIAKDLKAIKTKSERMKDDLTKEVKKGQRKIDAYESALDGLVPKLP